MTKQIDLCFIINNLAQGGAERQFFELIRNIDKQRFSVTLCLFAVNKGIFFSEIFDIPKIKIVQNALKYRNRVFKIVEALTFIRRFLKGNSYDIIHTTLFMNGLFVRLVAPRKYDNRIIASIRNSLKIYSKYHIFAEKVLIRRSYVVLNTKGAADEFIGRLPASCRERVYHIYNGYNPVVFRPKGTEKESGQILLGCVGRVTHQKNQMQVVRAVQALNNASIRLMIIGESSDQEDAINAYIGRNRLENQIILKPKQRNIEDYYNSFDIFVLPSLFEGCPNVLFEAMLSKCFCIISTNANTDEFVVHGVNGLVYDGTDGDLKEQIEYAISILGSNAFDRIRENGYRYATENFSMEKMVKSYEDLYGEIVSGYRPKRKSYVSTDVSQSAHSNLC